METLIFLVLISPVVVVIWLIARSFEAAGHIATLNRRLDELEALVIRWQSAASPAPVAASQQSEEPAAPPRYEPVPDCVPPWAPPWATAPTSFTQPVAMPSAPAVADQPPRMPTFAATVAAPTTVTAVEDRPPARVATAAESGSFEMRLGTYWLVRAGVVLLLTGLVFFGNYAYQNYLYRLGPAGKVALLYLASFGLMGAGRWWQRRSTPAGLRNYGQVVFAAGLAAVYFTTYAAHNLPPLCVIGSALLDGTLLLLWAGFMAGVAERWRSEPLALLAIGLAYYSASLTAVGSFTLFSNLVLAGAGIFFMLRHRWLNLSLGSLVATYLGYAFWRFHQTAPWLAGQAAPDGWLGAGFLVVYWVLFTAATLLARPATLDAKRRAAFATLNNTALFTLFFLTMRQAQCPGCWQFFLVYGTLLLGLAVLVRRWQLAEPWLANSYLTQGLLLVTLGWVAKLSGLQLALVLAVQSVVLLVTGTWQHRRLLKAGAYFTAALAVLWGLVGMGGSPDSSVWLGTAVGGFLVVNAVWSHRQRPRPAGAVFRREPGYFSLLAIGIWLAMLGENTAPENFPPAVALAAAVLTASLYLLRVPELALAGQGLLVLGNSICLVRIVTPSTGLEVGPTVVVLLVTLGLSHWWQRQKILLLDKGLEQIWPAIYPLALVALIYCWGEPRLNAPDWLVLTSVLAVVLTLYGWFTRLGWLAAFGQLFLLASVCEVAWQWGHQSPDWYFPLVPIAALAGLSAWAGQKTGRMADFPPDVPAAVEVVALSYRRLAMFLAIVWVLEYVPVGACIWVFIGLGLLPFAWAGWRRQAEALWTGAVFSGLGLVIIWWPMPADQLMPWPNVLALLVLLAQQQIVRCQPERYPVPTRAQMAVIVAVCASGWWWLTRAVMATGGEVYLTVAWAGLALALFLAGLGLAERCYRWTGLGILVLTLSRVLLIDVWKEETIFRVLTLMVVGLVLMAMGFIYNRYQEQMRRWL